MTPEHFHILYNLYEQTYNYKEHGRFASLLYKSLKEYPTHLHQDLENMGFLRTYYKENIGVYVGITFQGLWFLFLRNKGKK